MGDGALLQGKPRRGMLGFYIAGLVLVALAGFGAWFWTAWDNWHFGPEEAQRRQAEAARQLGVPVELSVDLPPSSSSAKASEDYGAAGGDGVKPKGSRPPRLCLDPAAPDRRPARGRTALTSWPAKR